MTRGFVSIVGAGPGAADLLTVRAARCLRRADLVLHDGLVSAAILRVARSARHESVARRAGTTGPSPAAVVERMVGAARRGDRVVRLKAGDPFVLARGAEEARGLVLAGVRFEVVPGLTSASAAPTLAGIPLTHRGVASGFVVVSGHSPHSVDAMLAALPAHSATIVVLMGLAARSRISARLIARGWRPDTPAAILWNASTPDGRRWSGTLSQLSIAVASATPLPSPAAESREPRAQSQGRPAPSAQRPTPAAESRAPRAQSQEPAAMAGVIVIGDVVEVGASIGNALAAPGQRERRRRARLADRTTDSAHAIQEAAWLP